jgi:hypothetical protein
MFPLLEAFVSVRLTPRKPRVSDFPEILVMAVSPASPAFHYPMVFVCEKSLTRGLTRISE